MSGVLDWLAKVVFGAANFFSNIRANRRDDPLLAEYKQLQRTCIASLLTFVVMLAGALLVESAATTFLEVLESLGAGRAVDGARRFVAYGFAASASAAAAYVAYSWFCLFRFARKHGVK